MVSDQPALRGEGAPLIRGEGTPESTWRPWLAAQEWPVLDVAALLDGDRALVVVAAHPDDEVLAVGGLLRQAATAGNRPLLLWATDGEASHPGSTAIGPADLARRRPAESEEALRRLGVLHRSVRLGLPDGGLTPRAGALANSISAVVRPGTVVLAPWRGDGHPDHDACGRAAATAAQKSGAILVEYPVWAWHWAGPGDDRLPWTTAQRVPLDDPTRSAKSAAVEAFTSQIDDSGPEPADAAVLSPAVLERFARDEEVVFVTEPSR